MVDALLPFDDDSILRVRFESKYIQKEISRLEHQPVCHLSIDNVGATLTTGTPTETKTAAALFYSDLFNIQKLYDLELYAQTIFYCTVHLDREILNSKSVISNTKSDICNTNVLNGLNDKKNNGSVSIPSLKYDVFLSYLLLRARAQYFSRNYDKCLLDVLAWMYINSLLPVNIRVQDGVCLILYARVMTKKLQSTKRSCQPSTSLQTLAVAQTLAHLCFTPTVVAKPTPKENLVVLYAPNPLSKEDGECYRVFYQHFFPSEVSKTMAISRVRSLILGLLRDADSRQSALYVRLSLRREIMRFVSPEEQTSDLREWLILETNLFAAIHESINNQKRDYGSRSKPTLPRKWLEEIRAIGAKVNVLAISTSYIDTKHLCLPTYYTYRKENAIRFAILVPHHAWEPYLYGFFRLKYGLVSQQKTTTRLKIQTRQSQTSQTQSTESQSTRQSAQSSQSSQSSHAQSFHAQTKRRLPTVDSFYVNKRHKGLTTSEKTKNVIPNTQDNQDIDKGVTSKLVIEQIQSPTPIQIQKEQHPTIKPFQTTTTITNQKENDQDDNTINRRRWNKELLALTDLLNARPDAFLYSCRASVYFSLQEWKRAEEDFELALFKMGQQKASPINLSLGDVYFQLAQTKEHIYDLSNPDHLKAVIVLYSNSFERQGLSPKNRSFVQTHLDMLRLRLGILKQTETKTNTNTPDNIPNIIDNLPVFLRSPTPSSRSLTIPSWSIDSAPFSISAANVTH